MNEMIERCAIRLAEMPLPCNRFNLRDTLIATMIDAALEDHPVAPGEAPRD